MPARSRAPVSRTAAGALPAVRTVVLAAGPLACFTTEVRRTGTPRTATEQLLVSTALDRALTELGFPEVEGRRVAVEVSSLNEGDAPFLKTALESRARELGARIVPAEEAERVLLARAGALGTDRRDTTFGLPSVPTPFGQTPPIHLLEYLHQEGTAKLALATRDDEGWHRASSATVRGGADVRIFVLLLLRIQLDDVSEDPPDVEDAGEG